MRVKVAWAVHTQTLHLMQRMPQAAAMVTQLLVLLPPGALVMAKSLQSAWCIFLLPLQTPARQLESQATAVRLHQWSRVGQQSFCLPLHRNGGARPKQDRARSSNHEHIE
jgi:hypothetical protein